MLIGILFTNIINLEYINPNVSLTILACASDELNVTQIHHFISFKSCVI